MPEPWICPHPAGCVQRRPHRHVGRPGAPGVVYDELVYDEPLRKRIENALFDADLFGLASSPSPDRIAGVVMHVLAEFGDELAERGRDHYYDHRHTGPIDHAAGVEDTLCWVAELLKGNEHPLPHEDWTK